MFLSPLLALIFTGLSSSTTAQFKPRTPIADTVAGQWSANVATQEPVAAPTRLVRRVFPQGGLGNTRPRDNDDEPDEGALSSQRQRLDPQGNFIPAHSAHSTHPSLQQGVTPGTFPQESVLQHHYEHHILQPNPLPQLSFPQHQVPQHQTLQQQYPQPAFPQRPLLQHFEPQRHDNQPPLQHFALPQLAMQQHYENVFARHGRQHLPPEPQRPPAGHASVQTSPTRPDTRDASTQTPGQGTGVEDLLRLHALNSMHHRLPEHAQRDVMKRVYPAKLAQVFWAANERQLRDVNNNLVYQDLWQDRHWQQNEAWLAPIVTRARDPFLAATQHDMRHIVDAMAAAREARPENLRDRRPLKRSAVLQARVESAVDRIRATAELAEEDALQELTRVHHDDVDFRRHVQRYHLTSRCIQNRRFFDTKATQNFERLWAEPIGLTRFTRDWGESVEDYVKSQVLTLFETRRDVPSHMQQQLYDGAIPLINAIERGLAAGIAHIRAHPGMTVLEMGANWIAWTYACMFYEHTCRRMGLPASPPHTQWTAQLRVNLNIIPPPLAGTSTSSRVEMRLC